MPDFVQRFGEPIGPDGEYILTSSRQSIITSLLSAGYVHVHIIHTLPNPLYSPGRLCEFLM